MAKPDSTQPHMNAAAFMAWHDTQPKGRRYELFDGHVHEMQSERAAHARMKAACYVALTAAIATSNLPCEAFPDGMAVRLDDETIFEPDALVRCGAPVPGETTLILDPLVVVEVLSPSTQHVDVFRKFNGYFRNPGVVHYLIINAAGGELVHHQRTPDGRIESSHWASGVLVLDPPRLSLDLDKLFGAE